MKLLIITIILLLAACGSQPEIIEKPVFVHVPITKYCVDAVPDEPVYDTARLTMASPLPVVADAYQVERYQRIIYIKQLRALMAGCINPEDMK